MNQLCQNCYRKVNKLTV